MSFGLNLGLGLGGSSPVLSAPVFPTLDNIINRTDFSNADAYTFSSGVLIASIAREEGTVNLAQADTGEQPEYDSTAIDGMGGMVIKAADNHLFYSMGSGLTAHTFGGVVVLPTHDSNYTIFALGTSGQPDNSAKLFHTGAGRVSWNRNEATSAVQLINTGSDGMFAFIVRVNSAASMDAYVSSTTPTNMDPDDLVTTRNHMYLGDNDLADTNMEYAEFFHTSDAITDEEVAAVMGYWVERYGITLS